MPRKWTNAEVKHKRKPEPQEKTPKKPEPKSYGQETMRLCPGCGMLLPHDLVEKILDPAQPEYICPNA